MASDFRTHARRRPLNTRLLGASTTTMRSPTPHESVGCTETSADSLAMQTLAAELVSTARAAPGANRAAARSPSAVTVHDITDDPYSDGTTHPRLDSMHDERCPRGSWLGQDDAMLTIKVIAPAALSVRVRQILETATAISSLRVFEGASAMPQGDVFEIDVPRESANSVISDLSESGVTEEGAIQILPIPTWMSTAGLRAEAQAPGAGADAVVWTDVVERAYDETELTWTYMSFMILATLLAAIAIITDSIILVIGAMVLGPEFVAIAALGLALVRGRPSLFRRSLRTLAAGFAVSISVVTALALLARVTGVITLADVMRSRPGTEFIYTPNWWSLIVAVIAGSAGVLALTSSKSGGLVGVFISVTTIPASGNIALALVFLSWHEVFGSAAQLVVNVIGMAAAGWATLLLQQWVWERAATAKVRRALRPQARH